MSSRPTPTPNNPRPQRERERPKSFLLLNQHLKRRLSITGARSIQAQIQESRILRKKKFGYPGRLTARAARRKRILDSFYSQSERGSESGEDVPHYSNVNEKERRAVHEIFSHSDGTEEMMDKSRVLGLLRQLPPLRVDGIERAPEEGFEEPQILRELDWNRQEQFWRQVRIGRSKEKEKEKEEEEVKDSVEEVDVRDFVCPGSWIATTDNSPGSWVATTDNSPDELQFSTAPLIAALKPSTPLERVEDVHQQEVEQEIPVSQEFQKSTTEATIMVKENEITEKQPENEFLFSTAPSTATLIPSTLLETAKVLDQLEVRQEIPMIRELQKSARKDEITAKQPENEMEKPKDSSEVKQEIPVVQELQEAMTEAIIVKEDKIREKHPEKEKDKSKDSPEVNEKETLNLGRQEVKESHWNLTAAVQEKHVAVLAAVSPSAIKDNREDYPFPRVVEPRTKKARPVARRWSSTSGNYNEQLMTQMNEQSIESTSTKSISTDSASIETTSIQSTSEALAKSVKREDPDDACEYVPGRARVVASAETRNDIASDKAECCKTPILRPEQEAETKIASNFSKERGIYVKSGASSPPSVNTSGPATPHSAHSAYELFMSAQKELYRSTSPAIMEAMRKKSMIEDFGKSSKGQSMDDPFVMLTPQAEHAPISNTASATGQISFAQAAQPGKGSRQSLLTLSDFVEYKTTRSSQTSPILLLRSAQSALRAVSPTLLSAAASETSPPTATPGFGREQKVSPSHENVESSHDDKREIDSSQHESFDLTKSEDEEIDPVNYKKTAVKRNLGSGTMKQLAAASSSLRLKIEGNDNGSPASSPRRDFRSSLGFLGRSRKRPEEKVVGKDNSSPVLEAFASKRNLGDAPAGDLEVQDSSMRRLRNVSEASSKSAPGPLLALSSRGAALNSHPVVQELAEPAEETQQPFSYTNTPDVFQTPKRSNRPVSPPISRSSERPKSYSDKDDNKKAHKIETEQSVTRLDCQWSPNLAAKYAEWERELTHEETPKEQQEEEAGMTVEENLAVETDDDDEEVLEKVLFESEWLANARIGTAEKMSLERPRSGAAIVHVAARSRGGSLGGEKRESRSGSGSHYPSFDAPTTSRSVPITTASFSTLPNRAPPASPSPLSSSVTTTTTDASIDINDTASRKETEIPQSIGQVSVRRSPIVVKNPVMTQGSNEVKHHKRVDSLVDMNLSPYSNKNAASSTSNLSITGSHFFDSLKKRYRQGQEDRRRSSIAVNSIASTFDSEVGDKKPNVISKFKEMDIGEERGDGDASSVMTGMTGMTARTGRKRERMKRFFGRGKQSVD